MFEIPFYWRIIALVIAAAFFVLLDYRKAAAQRGRVHEYTFLFSMGLAGAVFGAVNDWITSTIAPEYFVFGKGLLEGPGLTAEAMQLGAQAGFAAGFVGAALVLYFAGKHSDVRGLYRWSLLPFATGAVAGCGAGLVSWQTGWLQLLENPEDIMTPDELHRFHIVWHIHLGLYLGATAGVVWVIRRLRKDLPCKVKTDAACHH